MQTENTAHRFSPYKQPSNWTDSNNAKVQFVVLEHDDVLTREEMQKSTGRVKMQPFQQIMVIVWERFFHKKNAHFVSEHPPPQIVQCSGKLQQNGAMSTVSG